jgi:hypothetical protein
MRKTGFVNRRRIATEFEQDFKPRDPHRLLGDGNCIFEKEQQFSWKDKASWRYVYINSLLWKKLPVEIYKLIDNLFVETIYKCIVCQKSRVFFENTIDL